MYRNRPPFEYALTLRTQQRTNYFKLLGFAITLIVACHVQFVRTTECLFQADHYYCDVINFSVGLILEWGDRLTSWLPVKHLRIIGTGHT